MRPAIVVATLLLSARPTLSQSAFLPPDSGGVLFGSGALFNQNGYSFGGTLGYSIAGRFDLRFSVASVTLSSANASGTAIAPAIEFMFLKPHPTGVPFGISIGVSYESTTLTSDFAPTSGGTTVGALAFSSALFWEVEVTRECRVLPVTEAILVSELGESRNVITIYDPLSSGGTGTVVVGSSSRSSRFIWTFGLGIVIGAQGGNQVILSPQIGTSEGITAIGIEVGLVQ